MNISFSFFKLSSFEKIVAVLHELSIEETSIALKKFLNICSLCHFQYQPKLLIKISQNYHTNKLQRVSSILFLNIPKVTQRNT